MRGRRYAGWASAACGVVGLALGLGCGRAHFAELHDAARGEASPDAPAVAASCDPATPFGVPVQVPGVNDPVAYDSTFVPSHDELTAYFYSNRMGDADIYRATRPDRASAWTVARVDELATPAVEQEPSLSPDGTVLTFSTTRAPNVGNLDIWYATYDGATFTVVGPLSQFDTTATDYHPVFQDASDQFWFSSNVAGTFSIYHASHTGTSFGPATIESELDVPGTDTGAAAPSSDGLTIYFRSDRNAAIGDYDIYVARRASTSVGFGPATAVTEVNSPSLDTPNWISADGCRLYLSSSRDDASNIYVATKPAP
jgi:Tol biopolymer transport system component